MNTRNKLNKSEIVITERILNVLKNADAVVIGAGAGLSASAGLDYNDTMFFEKHYSHFRKKGFKTISEGIRANWNLDKENAVSYWGFWANHISNVFYKQPQLPTYKLLYDIIKDKPYFIITTNADGQFYKGDFDAQKIFAMQGSYSKFQCQKKCHNVIYDNEKMVSQMLNGFDSGSLEIKSEDIPKCPVCHEFLVPNLRTDGNFVEEPNMVNKDEYIHFINSYAKSSIVFLELGVGYNTPIIIRFPFEQMTNSIKDGWLIRVNKYYPDLPQEVTDKAIATKMDINELLNTFL